ncbi:MAG: outer membrane beta-barrel protein [Desulfobacteraceae bacterium]|jgi:hypothetical protein
MNRKQLILVFITLFLVPQTLFASYQVEVTPSLTLSELYDDNIYLDNLNKQDDWITSISPGLNLDISSQKNNFILNYSPSIVRYKERDDNDTVRHALTMSLDSAISQHLELNISDTFLRSEEPIEETQGIIGIRATRNTYIRNNGDASIRYTFGSSNSFLIGSGYSYLDNEDLTIDDGTIIDPYASYSYWFNMNHGLELSGGYTNAEFSRDDDSQPGNDYTGSMQGIGYRYRANPRSTLLIDFSLTSRDFDSSTTDYEVDYGVYEGTIGCEKNISEDFSYSVSAGYFTRQDDTEDDDNGFNFDISLTKNFERGSFSLNGRSGWGEAYLESERRGFTKNQSITSSYNYQVTENISNNASISYRQDKDEAARKSKSIEARYGWSLSLFRYYLVSLDYTCAVRDDDLDSDDYLVNRVMFSLRWSRPYR